MQEKVGLEENKWKDFYKFISLRSDWIIKRWMADNWYSCMAILQFLH